MMTRIRSLTSESLRSREESQPVNCQAVVSAVDSCHRSVSPQQMPPDPLIHFFPAGIDGAVEGVRSCLSSGCLRESFLSPSSLNESSCVQQNDLD